jgi:hypothetical protein
MIPDEERRGGFGRAIETLRLPHFAPLFGANFVQAFCGQIMMMAMQWLTIDQLTEERTLYFIIPFLQGGVAALLSPYAGVIADRVSKRALLVGGRLLLAVIVLSMATLVWTGLVTLTHVYLASLVGGVISAMMQPAGQTFVFDIVGRDRLENAISLPRPSLASRCKPIRQIRYSRAERTGAYSSYPREPNAPPLFSVAVAQGEWSHVLD